MECSEFLSRFSEFYDTPRQAKLRPGEARFQQQAEAHVARCENCAQYARAVADGTAVLQTLPRVQLSESFRSTLEHRLFHLEDENAFVRAVGASAVPAMTAVGMAVVLAVVAWSPAFVGTTVEVELAPIFVSAPPSPEPARVVDIRGFTPPKPAPVLTKGLWADPNALLFEYSAMRERYQTENPLRQAGF